MSVIPNFINSIINYLFTVGRCTKDYPKQFQEHTLDTDDSYPTYRRRNNGVNVVKKVNKQDIEIDNRWVIPHNLYLATKYNCHINVEICSSVQAVKYLYKYVYKGPDKVMSEKAKTP